MILYKLFAVSCLISAGTAVTIDVNTSDAPDLAGFGETVRQTLLQWFDRVGEILHSPTYVPTTVIYIYFDPTYDGVAYASGNRIVGSVNYYRNNQGDVGSMVHEMAHVIQGYRGCYTSNDWYITEGIADWVRFWKYEPNNMPGKPGGGSNYTQGYRTTAYFLNYVNELFAEPSMVYWINKDCREGTYNPNHEIFFRLTQKTIDQHWADMMNSAKEEGLDFSHVESPFQNKCLASEGY